MQDDPSKPQNPDHASAAAVQPASKEFDPSGMVEPTSLDTSGPSAHNPANPAWANDLRKLYDSVVEEPLPDSLLDLLSQLDAED